MSGIKCMYIWRSSRSSNNVSCHVCKEDFPDRDALKIHMQLHGPVTQYLCPDCDYESPHRDDIQHHAIQQHKQPIIDVKENKVQPISPNQTEQSQSKSMCKTQGLPKLVTTTDNISCDEIFQTEEHWKTTCNHICHQQQTVMIYNNTCKRKISM